MKKTFADKQNARIPVLISRTAEVFGCTPEEAVGILSTRQQSSFRINTLRTQTFDETFPVEAIEWARYGYTTSYAGLSHHNGSNNGSIYIQNPSSWLPVLALDPVAGESILDMCAAPGGKTSHIAAQTQNSATIDAYDVSKDRLMRMRRLHTILGVKGVHYILRDARSIKQAEGLLYDKVLLDAACSGETEIHDLNADIGTWSVPKIKRLQILQKALITTGLQVLKPGGVLVYSTCTYAPEENEAVLDYALRRFDNVALAQLEDNLLDIPELVPALASWKGKSFNEVIPRYARRVRPSSIMQGFFVAKLVKLP